MSKVRRVASMSKRPRITTFPAGRELDALIAEKVMGLHPGKKWRKIGDRILPDGTKEPLGNEYWFLLDAQGHTQQVETLWGVEDLGVPFYSTSIEVAWQVVERLALVYSTSREGLSGYIGDTWRLVKTFRGDIRLDIMTPIGIIKGPEADTAPLAICYAALCVKMGER